MLSILSARTSLGAEMRELLPTAVAEMRAVLAADAELGDFAAITTPTLMLSGGWSPAYFAETGRQLADAVPALSFAVVPGQLHEGPIRPGSRLALRAARFLLGGTGATPCRQPGGRRHSAAGRAGPVAADWVRPLRAARRRPLESGATLSKGPPWPSSTSATAP